MKYESLRLAPERHVSLKVQSLVLVLKESLPQYRLMHRQANALLYIWGL
jgi:hypothetical protein